MIIYVKKIYSLASCKMFFVNITYKEKNKVIAVYGRNFFDHIVF